MARGGVRTNFVYVIDSPGPYTRDTMKAVTVPSKHISNFLRLGENMLPTGGQ